MEYLVPAVILSTQTFVQVYSLCSSRQFSAVHGKFYPGPRFYSYTKSALSLEQCERMCRQLLGCDGFNVKWSGVQGNSGYCQFFKSDHTITAIADGTMSLYREKVSTPTSCPAGFTLFPTTGHCYMAVSTIMTWTEARDHCASLSPPAYIAGTQTVEEFEYIESIADGLYWLGSMRQPEAGQNEFYWEHTGGHVSDGYTNWYYNEPDTHGNCLLVLSGFFWDQPCFMPHSFVCEYNL